MFFCDNKIMTLILESFIFSLLDFKIFNLVYMYNNSNNLYILTIYVYIKNFDYVGKCFGVINAK